MYGKLNFNVIDSVLKPFSNEKNVYYKKREDKILYKVRIYLDGEDLLYVKSVTYHLHRTFSNPIRKIRRTVSNPNCELIIWTWGLFKVKVQVEDKKGNIYPPIIHQLTYDAQLRLSGVKFIDMNNQMVD